MDVRARKRRWSSHRPRFGRRSRGVSDMVATILIVMITVVLAAVLYIMISTLTRSTGSDPLGSAFTWGAPNNVTGTSTFGCTSPTHYCYHIEIAYTSSNLGVSSVTIALQSRTGQSAAWPTSVTGVGGRVLLVSPVSSTVTANYWPSNLTWQLIPPFTGTLASGFSLVIYCGGAAESAGQGLAGLAVVAVGTNGYGGTVPASPFS
jgi:FlaG/FlaF family flagellin (archaellin)